MQMAEYRSPDGVGFSVHDMVHSSDPEHSKVDGHQATNGTLPKDYPQKLSYAVVWTDDNKKTAEFWKATLGFSYNFQEKFPDWTEMIPPQKDGTKIGVHATSKDSPNKAGTMELGFAVPDLEAFHQRVSKDTRLTVVSPPKKTEWGSQMAEYKSPDGIGFTVIQDMQPPASEPTKGSAICHIEIPCGDLQRAEKFYGTVFNWSFPFRMEDYVIWKANDMEYDVAGGLLKSDVHLPRPWLHLFVPNIEEALEKVKANGGEVLKERFEIPGGHGFNAFFKDTEGNQMSLYETPKKQ